MYYCILSDQRYITKAVVQVYECLLESDWLSNISTIGLGNSPIVDKNSLILDFNCQPLRRVPICFMSVGPYRPGGVLSRFQSVLVYSRKDPNVYVNIRIERR